MVAVAAFCESAQYAPVDLQRINQDHIPLAQRATMNAAVNRLQSFHRWGQTICPVDMSSPSPNHTSCRFDSSRNGTYMRISERIPAGGRKAANSDASVVDIDTCCPFEVLWGGLVRLVFPFLWVGIVVGHEILRHERPYQASSMRRKT